MNLTVSVPARVACLPTDPRGYPVPFVADWQSPMLLPPRVDPRFGMVCDNLDDHGPPTLGLMNPTRQRECMLTPRCQVCGADLRKGRRYFAGGVQLEWFTEPAACFECMVFAVQVCPGLLRGRRRDLLVVVEAGQDVQLRQACLGRDPKKVVHRPLDHYNSPDEFTALYFIEACPGPSATWWSANDWLAERT